MGNSLNEIIHRTSPGYQIAYTEGFEAGKRMALRELKEAIHKIKSAEAFSTSTSTITNEDNLK